MTHKGNFWSPYADERAEYDFEVLKKRAEEFDGDADLHFREEAFGERPVLGPWGDPFHGPDVDEPVECGLENPEVCEACD